MINDLRNKKLKLLKEYISLNISSLIINEQQAQQGQPQLNQMPMSPTDQSAPLGGMDPMAGSPQMPPGADPAMAGGMGMDGGLPDTGGDPSGSPDDADTEEDADAESGSEDTIPEDPTQDIVDKVMEKMETDMDTSSGNDGTLVNLAKAYLQDYGLLDPSKINDARTIIQKFREQNIPELNKVAFELEKFLSN